MVSECVVYQCEVVILGEGNWGSIILCDIYLWGMLNCEVHS